MLISRFEARRYTVQSRPVAHNANPLACVRLIAIALAIRSLARGAINFDPATSTRDAPDSPTTIGDRNAGALSSHRIKRKPRSLRCEPVRKEQKTCPAQRSVSFKPIE